jgi:hypothetical protein
MQASDTILYTGTCDNLDCAGETFGDCNPGETPIRVYADGDGRLWMQAKGPIPVDEEADEYVWSDWSNDAVPSRMRDWEPELSADFTERLLDAGLLDY